MACNIGKRSKCIIFMNNNYNNNEKDMCKTDRTILFMFSISYDQCSRPVYWCVESRFQIQVPIQLEFCCSM